ncbi:MAG: CHAT domain-containing tetratricopeptide repeat protein [Acidobacteriota bacterium]
MTPPIKLRIAFCISLLVSSDLTVSRRIFACETQSDEQTRSLEPNKPAEDKLAAGQSHHYLLDLVEGQYVRIMMEKNTADLILVLSRPDGEKITEAKSASPQEPLGAILIASLSGKHLIEVRSLARSGTDTHYKLSIAELRTATQTDHSRAAAAKAYTEGARLIEQDTKQSLTDSIEKFKAAMSLFSAIGERKDEAAMLGYLGYVYHKLNRHEEAIQSYTQALSIYKAVRDSRSEAAMLANTAAVYERLGEKQKAIQSHQQSLAVARETGNKDGEAVALNSIGRIYNSMGENRKALEFYNQTILLHRNAGNRRGEADALRTAAGIHFFLTEYQNALDLLNQVLTLARSLEDRRREALIISDIGRVHSSMSEFQKALDFYNQSLSIYRAAGYRAGEGPVINAIGQIYNSLGEREKALDFYNQSLSLSRETKDRLGEATALNNIAAIFAAKEDYRKALEFYDQSLSLFRALGNRSGEAALLNNMGTAYTALNESRKAFDLYSQALSIHRAAGNRRSEANTLNNMGRTLFLAGEHQKSLDFLNQALSISRATVHRRLEAQALYNIANAHRALGNFAEARMHSGSAVRVAESLRGEVDIQQLRASYFASVRNYYDLDIDLLMRLHKQNPLQGFDTLALETSERARARSLLELLAEARADIRQGVDSTLIERERQLQKSLNDKAERQTQLLSGRHTPEQAAAAAKEIESLVAQYTEAQTQIRTASPRYAALTQPQPARFKDIQQQVDENTILLEYALGDERSYLWAVSAKSIASFELPRRAEIEAAAKRFYELLRSAGDAGRGGDGETRGRGESEEAARQLSRMLLAPVAGRLGSKRLLIVADGILHYIPFAALPSPKASVVSSPLSVAKPRQRTTDNGQRTIRPLIADHEIISLPSASVLAEMRREIEGRKPAPGAVAVFADPVFSMDDTRLKSTVRSSGQRLLTRDLQRAATDLGAEGFPRLPFSRREAEAIIASAPRGQAIKSLDFEASRNRVTGLDLGNYRIIHFATHGLLNSTHPELSGIVLSLVDEEGQAQNGFLRLHEIYNLKLPAELVVLSACQTGLGKEIRGEGLVGLTRGFMYAGAARIVASLWKVDDAATAELMKRFYQKVFVRKLRPAAALREAQVEMWNQERWREPYYWAAFVMQGEWK